MRATAGLFLLEDWHHFGADYYKTLTAWHDNFEKYSSTGALAAERRFYRAWRYYLLSYAGSFKARTDQLWQIVLSKHGVPGGYDSL